MSSIDEMKRRAETQSVIFGHQLEDFVRRWGRFMPLGEQMEFQMHLTRLMVEAWRNERAHLGLAVEESYSILASQFSMRSQYPLNVLQQPIKPEGK